jgi:hypothetical protein
MGGFSESDLAVLTNILKQNLSDYAGPDVELVVFAVDNAAASTTQLTCLQLPIPTLSPAREILGATFDGAFRAFFVLNHTLTSWRFANLPHRFICR